ncbi:hypothetical protein [Aeromicrobium alkaliterrae]|uniref:DUF3800 domain-containing protein n=1 Tax=Aeromicrobium alkaliterrae TaxID=302168 RepID=A0ABN2JXW8_9ACTN
MSTHYFIDETKAKGYVVVIASCPSESLAAMRRVVSRLVLPGQRSIHMKNESPRRRRQIAGAFVGLSERGIQATVLDAGRGPESERLRRARALRAVVALTAEGPSGNLVLDLDRTMLARDRRVLSSALREFSADHLSYAHLPFSAEPLLAIPDVVAWSWARGGEWRARIQPLIRDHRDV